MGTMRKQIFELRQLAQIDEEGYKLFKEVEKDPWTAKLLTDESAVEDLRATATYNQYVAHSKISEEMKTKILFEVSL